MPRLSPYVRATRALFADEPAFELGSARGRIKVRPGRTTYDFVADARTSAALGTGARPGTLLSARVCGQDARALADDVALYAGAARPRTPC